MDFYKGIVEWSEGEETSALCSVWAWATHIGEAVQKMLKCAEKAEIETPFLLEINYYDEDEVPETVITNDDGDTYIESECYEFPPDGCYRLPFGVIHTGEEGEFEVEHIEEGYQIIKDDDGLFEVEVVVDKERILDVYFKSISSLPEIRTFWIKLQDDWDDFGKEEIFVNDNLNSPEKIKKYIIENKSDTFLNGHLTLTTYSDEGQTNLNISDHKMLVLISYDENITESFCELLKKENLTEKEELICIARGFNHFHYRHHNGLDRKELVETLQKQGFGLWDPDDSIE